LSINATYNCVCTPEALKKSYATGTGKLTECKGKKAMHTNGMTEGMAAVSAGRLPFGLAPCSQDLTGRIVWPFVEPEAHRGAAPDAMRSFM
jgi:hypothetical protein